MSMSTGGAAVPTGTATHEYQYEYCAPPPIMNMNTQGFKYQAFHEYLNTNLFAAARFVPNSWNDHQKSGILEKESLTKSTIN